MAMQQGGTRPYPPAGGVKRASSPEKEKKTNNTLLFSLITLGLLGIGLVIFQFIFNNRKRPSQWR
ncbi:MAG: hypothetical protein R2912_10020 [Eubacteriales bacterium]